MAETTGAPPVKLVWAYYGHDGSDSGLIAAIPIPDPPEAVLQAWRDKGSYESAGMTGVTVRLEARQF